MAVASSSLIFPCFSLATIALKSDRGRIKSLESLRRATDTFFLKKKKQNLIQVLQHSILTLLDFSPPYIQPASTRLLLGHRLAPCPETPHVVSVRKDKRSKPLDIQLHHRLPASYEEIAVLCVSLSAVESQFKCPWAHIQKLVLSHGSTNDELHFWLPKYFSK